MDQHRFDALSRAVGASVSRRGAIKGLLGAAVAAALAPLGVEPAAAAIRPDCRKRNRNCRVDSQCCSRNCRKGRCACPKGTAKVNGVCRPPDNATCPTDPNINYCDVSTITACSGDATGYCQCHVTIEGTPFCIDPTSTTCSNCTASSDCGPNQACIYHGSLSCGCRFSGGPYGCADPCPV